MGVPHRYVKSFPASMCTGLLQTDVSCRRHHYAPNCGLWILLLPRYSEHVEGQVSVGGGTGPREFTTDSD